MQTSNFRCLPRFGLRFSVVYTSHSQIVINEPSSAPSPTPVPTSPRQPQPLLRLTPSTPVPTSSSASTTVTHDEHASDHSRHTPDTLPLLAPTPTPKDGGEPQEQEQLQVDGVPVYSSSSCSSSRLPSLLVSRLSMDDTETTMVVSEDLSAIPTSPEEVTTPPESDLTLVDSKLVDEEKVGGVVAGVGDGDARAGISTTPTMPTSTETEGGTKAAVHIKPDDGAASAAWRKRRAELDSRLKNSLENIKFCWFGAFKTILSPKCTSNHEAITMLEDQFEKVFRRSFEIQDTKRGGNPRKTSSQHLPQSFNQVRLDDSLSRCFSTLSSKCRDEELEDLIYFILDLYQFHGVAIPISEVDITQMVVDLRTILEEHTMKTRGPINKKTSTITPESDDEHHVFLVLDKNLQGLPWESIPILRGRSVSRIPSVDFLIDRLEYVEVRKRYRRAVKRTSGVGTVVDPRKGFFILNPSGDLRKTQERFKDWADGMKKTGWDGVVGKPISEQQFENALRQSDLVVYFGHGGGEQYLRSYKIRRLQTCAATMLWGCSSGALREMGDFDRTGTANAYMLGGCPTLVANLWDVTDRDIDKFSQAVFDKVKLTPENVRAWGEADIAGVSLVSAVAQTRSVCKLKYLTGAAPVVYGIPFYL
ncbi:Separin [Leucoagaricus sp. SymC.cos]|nr:Separin [Leucoagaricus sp. SymC.cos]